MSRIFVFVAVFLFGVVLQGGNAAYHECPVPPESILVYFDMAQISSLMPQPDFTSVFQEPVKCENGNDKVCEDNQQCCRNEIGCCSKANRICGCKEKGSSVCSYPSPLAVLGKSECTADRNRTSVTSLRERRGEDNFNILGNISKKQPGTEAEASLGRSVTLFIDASFVYGNNDNETNGLRPKFPIILQQLSVQDLAKSLNRTVIDSLIEFVEEKIFKGESYGLPEIR